MKTQTLNRLKKINGQIARIYEHLEEYPEAYLNTQINEGKWSVLQIMEHLRVTEQQSLDYIKKKMHYTSDFKEAGLRSKYNSWILNKLIDSPKKMKAPKIEGLSPVFKSYRLKESKDSFLTLRKDLYHYLDQLDEDLFTKAIYKHPAIGRLNFIQMIEFFSRHIKRHLKQIKKITAQHKLEV